MERLSDSQIQSISEVCGKYGHDFEQIVNILYQVQKIFGYLPETVQQAVAAEMKLPVEDIYDVVTSYSMFIQKPVGRYPVSVCIGHGCAVRGAGPVLQEIEKELGIQIGEVTEDGLFSLDTFCCVGACGQAPVVIIDKKLYGHVSPDKVKSILDQYRKDCA